MPAEFAMMNPRNMKKGTWFDVETFCVVWYFYLGIKKRRSRNLIL